MLDEKEKVSMFWANKAQEEWSLRNQNFNLQECHKLIKVSAAMGSDAHKLTNKLKILPNY